MSSLINPNNIDGTYPIAGQDNDSQGFRDNFTNIKNNLTFAKTELDDLQKSVILKSAIANVDFDNEMSNTQLKGVQCLRFTETINHIAGNGNTTVSWGDAHFQILTTTSAVNLTFVSWPTSGFYTALTIEFKITDITHTVTLPTEVSVNIGNIRGASGHTITFPTAGTYRFEFSTYDNGETITIRDLLRNHVA